MPPFSYMSDKLSDQLDNASWTDDLDTEECLTCEDTVALAELFECSKAQRESAVRIACLPSSDICTCHRSEVASSNADRVAVDDVALDVSAEVWSTYD